MAKKAVTALLIVVTLLAALLPHSLGSTASPVHAQTGVTWNAAYYNNPYLLDEPVLTRQEPAIAFNWGGGSPAAGVNADNFSASFWANVRFEPGTYRFYVLADDGVQLFAGERATWGEPVIDTYNRPRPGQMLTADVEFRDGGVMRVAVNFREETGEAYLYVSWEKISAGGTTGPNFPAPVTTTGSWWAEYFSNSVLAGAPIVTRTESSPSQNWGNASPADGVPADNFSARFSTVRYFDAGTYLVSVRADDGVRVNVNGQWIINEWHGATGQTYTGSFTVNSGQYGIVIEFYEATGLAYLEFSITRTSSPITVTGATATINAYILNVRNAPDPVNGAVIAKVRRGESYQVVGRNSDSSWWQIALSGTTGWVSGRYVTVQNAWTVPVTGAVYAPTPVPTVPSYIYGECPGFLPSRLVVGGWGRVTPGMANNLRAQPSTVSQWLGQIPAGGVFEVVGGPVCGENTAWWQVRYYGLIGWTPEGQSGTYWLEPFSW